MSNVPLGACDRRMGFMAQTLGPRTGPAGASTVSESRLLDSTSCSSGDSTMPRFEAASLLSTPVLIAYGICSAIAFVAMLYKAQHEQLDIFMASAWIYQSNGCLLVRRRVVSQ